jgi:hypothetical protein
MTRSAVLDSEINEELAKAEKEMTENFAILANQKDFLKEKRKLIDTMKKFTPVSKICPKLHVNIHSGRQEARGPTAGDGED